MPDEIKYRIIKGRGEEEEKELKTSKDILIKKEKIEAESIPPEKTIPTFKITKKEPIPEKLPEIEPIEIPEPTEEKLIKSETKKTPSVKLKIPNIEIPKIQIKPSFKINKKLLTLLAFLILIPFIIYGGFYALNKIDVFNNIFKKETPKEERGETEEKIITSIFQQTTPTDIISTQTEEVATASLTQLTESTITTSTESTISTTSQLTTTPTLSTISTLTPLTSSAPTKTEIKELPKAEEEKLETPSPKSEEIKEIKIEDIEKQGTKTVFPYLKVPEINISLDELTTNDFRLKWLDLIKIQKSAGSLYKINFFYNNQVLLSDFIKDYFITPSFIEKKYQEAFKNSLGDSYVILMYYTYTRKFPVIIFTIKDENVVVPFMRLWDKESLLDDFKKLYLGLPKGKLIRLYTITEEYEGVKYKIAYYDNDYKFIWTIYNNNLIISTSLNAFKYIIKNFK